MFKRLIALFLVLITIAVPAAGCANETSGGQQSSKPESSQSSGDQPDSPYLDLGLPEKDYNGRAFRYISRDGDLSAPVDLLSDGLNTDPLNNAVFERNSIIQDLYDVKFQNAEFEYPYKTLTISVKSDLDEYDIVIDAIRDLAGLVTENMFYDIEESTNYVDFSKEWWDQRCLEGTSVLNRVFFATGDISVMDNKSVWALMFNKGLISANNLENPYDLVASENWTFEKMFNMMEIVTQDIDADGVLERDADQWGLLTEQFNTFAFTAGSGAFICEKDENDRPIFTFFEYERNGDALAFAADINKVGQYATNSNASLTKPENMFYSGRALFNCASMLYVELLRPYDVDFGVLPLPKYDAEQDGYYSTMTPFHFCVYAMPASIPEENLEFVDVILENLAAYSNKLVKPAYYDKILVGKGLRDQESEPMLNIIFSNVMYDVGIIYNFGGFSDIISSIAARKVTSFISNGARVYGGGVNKAINTFIDYIEKHYPQN